GYGLPTFTLLGSSVIRLPFIKETSLGHEVLHSWFGNSIDLKEGSGNWLEGLTTYLSDQLYKEDQGKGAEYRKNQLLRYQGFVGDEKKYTLGGFQNVGHDAPGAEAIRTVGYDKGAMFFHMLKQELGEDVFFAGLRRLVAEKLHASAGWDDLREIFSSTAVRDLSSFFSQWLDRADIPNLSIKKATVSQQGGRSHISFHLEQGTDEKYNDINIPVLVETITGPVKTSIRLQAADTLYTVSVDSLPLTLTLDPEYDLMRTPSLPEFAPTWSRFMGASAKKALLGREEDRALYQPLIDYLNSIRCPVILADQVKNGELSGGSFLFLGPSTHSRALFAGPSPSEQGFSLDVRNNPFDPRQVMVLAAAENVDELMAAVHKIRHYGQYGFLRFKGGKNIAKEVPPSQNGMRVELMELPTAMPVNRLTDFQTVIEEIKGSRVIYLGENHTDYGNHILQLQVIQALHAKGLKLAVGMEMFPRSSQTALDDYVGGVVADEKEFLTRSRYFSVWGYDYRLYRDIIEFAKKCAIPLVGLNLDKEIVSQAFRTGNLDELTDEQRRGLPADRDLDLPGYRERLEAIHSFHETQDKSEESFNGFLQAQALWDETMGETIAAYITVHPDTIMVVLVGGGHVYKADAIPPRVARRITVEQRVLVGMDSLEPDHNRENFADYILRMPYGELSPAAKIGVSLVEEKSDEDGGTKVKVVGISPHGKAGDAGIQKDDYIVEVDGTKITTVGELKACLLDKEVGDFAMLTVERAELLHIKVELSSLESFGGMMPPSHPPVGK
ncbi:MAG: ChaN family lipoprotein, partial [Desulfobulbaceae bacterium]|nr:ChaN family lipoprotein [Desulfobulbaceae bacterium]